MNHQFLAAVGILLGASSIAGTPLASADPPSIPAAGSETAAATIRDLDAAGYDVQLQFTTGTPDVPLSQCNVTDIDPLGVAGSQKIAYVTISCPK
jgi:hypothetical protein